MSSLDLAKEFRENRYKSDITKIMKSAKIEEMDPEKVQGVLQEITQKLCNFPHWNQYVVNQLDIRSYSYDGEARKASVGFEPESYLRWISRSEEMKRRSKLLGISEVFSQDFSEESPAMPKQQESKRRVNRRWKILKASELVKD